jgi:glutathione S-transferase
MSEFVVHTVPGSPFARAVMATLEEKGATWRLAPMKPAEVRAEPHLSRHPFARIPVLEHDGFSLYETQAILRYLDRVLPAPPLTPAEPRAAARMDQILAISDWYLFQGVNNVIGFQRVVRPRLAGLAPDEEAIAQAMPKAHVVFGALSGILGKAPFFAGPAISLADLMIVSQMDFLAQSPEWGPLTEKASNLASWMDRMSARPSVVATTWDRIAAPAAAG